MIAISIRQPWADLIAQGIKTIEVRTWRTHHRGDLLICASAAPVMDWIDAGGQAHRLPAGAQVCIARLADCRPLRLTDLEAACISLDDWRCGLYAWHLEHIRPVIATPHRGRLGLHPVADHLIRPT